MSGQNGNYKAGRLILGWVETIGSSAIVFGFVAAALGVFAGSDLDEVMRANRLSTSFSVMFLIPGLGLVAWGAVAIAIAQAAKAQIETAENTKEILEVLRRKSDTVSDEFKDSVRSNQSYSISPPQISTEDKQALQIEPIGEFYVAGGRYFTSEDEAKSFIDSLQRRK